MTSLCSAASLARDEPMAGTASRVDRWLLVEHRGPWGPPSLPLARMDPQLVAHLVASAATHGARLLLVRRPKGVPCPPGRWVYLVDSRPGRERMRRQHVPDDDALRELTLPPDEEVGWETGSGPLLLVCTHGRHDTCCAILGRPVAAALSALHPDAVWECSHPGGDRFAANVLVMPHGLYLGRVTPPDAGPLLADLAAGRVPVPLVRGRSSLTLPAQAAQHFARVRYGRAGLDDLLPVAQVATGPDTWTVRLAGPPGEAARRDGGRGDGGRGDGGHGDDAGEVEVVVRYDRHGDGARHLLTCGALETRSAPVFHEVSVQPAGSAGRVSA